jgi:hypothetical protein
VCTIEVPGIDADRLQQQLRTRHGILVQSMTGNARAPEIRGIRVTPNVFTTLAELDRFVVGLKAAVREIRDRPTSLRGSWHRCRDAPPRDAPQQTTAVPLTDTMSIPLFCPSTS